MVGASIYPYGKPFDDESFDLRVMSLHAHGDDDGRYGHGILSSQTRCHLVILF